MINAGSSIEALTAGDMLMLVEAGIRAPSADNRHVVRFRATPHALRLRVPLEVLNGAPAHRMLFHELAFGAVIENIALRAAELGRVAQVDAKRTWRSDGVIADIELPSADLAPDPLARAIATRTTNRRLYRRRPAPPDILDALAGAAASRGDVRVHWLDEPRARRRALTVIRIAEAERFCCERLHEELFEAIRFDVGWRGGADEGLPPGSLQVERPFRIVFEALRRWKLQRAVNRLGAATMLGMRAGWLPAAQAPHVALLSVPHASGSFIDAGRALQRFWLAATLQRIALQPLAASIALAHQDAHDRWASAEASARVVAGLDRLADGRVPVMLCRLGYAVEPSLRAGRREAASYLERADD